MLIISMIVIIFSMIVLFTKLILSNTLFKRLVFLNLFSLLITMLLVTYAVYSNEPFIMDIAIAYSIIGFLALVLLLRFTGSIDES
ncbi:monovalent cation/H+ antiporter complex subunit F [Helicovermis profundi]|uniref:NADH dehydrogenase subunit 4L n=1 Tax=Helicovermis profundi TaxID=3065157 RepID=A0AAU9ELI3_9FIRM|nr:hypothetical protein HLPR_04470 [Clostridia bacterium S502]